MDRLACVSVSRSRILCDWLIICARLPVMVVFPVPPFLLWIVMVFIILNCISNVYAMYIESISYVCRMYIVCNTKKI